MTSRVFLVLLAALTACNSKPDGPVDQYAFRGEVVHVDSGRGVVTVKHDAILKPSGEVWMEAMTMEFPVRDKVSFVNLKPGTRFRATLFQRQSDLDYWLADIKIE